MAVVGLCHTIDVRVLEWGKCWVVSAMEAFGLDTLSPAFHQIEMGRIRQDQQERKAEAFRLGHHVGLPLVACIIQNAGNQPVG